MPVDTHFRDVIVHLTYSRLHKTNILQDLQLLTLVGRTKEVLVPPSCDKPQQLTIFLEHLSTPYGKKLCNSEF